MKVNFCVFMTVGEGDGEGAGKSEEVRLQNITMTNDGLEYKLALARNIVSSSSDR